MATETRTQYQEELDRLEASALGGLDLVNSALERTLEAARIADTTAFMLEGELIEHGPTNKIFTTPEDERTERYVTGKFG
jgi:ABC-type proline/glycine betaine transport system ATPase subunit